MKLKDIGRVLGGPEDMSMAMPSKPIKMYPSLRISTQQLPDLDNYDVGETVTIECEAKIMSKDIIPGETNDRVMVGIDVIKAGIDRSNDAEENND